jgi:hypothetical protein
MYRRPPYAMPQVPGPGNGAYPAQLGAFGWNTGFESIMPRGHEILTERALNVTGPGAGGVVRFVAQGRSIDTTLAPAEVSEIIEGNRAVDVADLRETQHTIGALRARPYLPLLPIVGPPLTAAAAAYSAGQAAAHVVHSVREEDQKRHALRRNPGQNWRDALREIVLDLRNQHNGILAEANARFRLRRIGAALHLIQDSYCPAHTDRSASLCIQYVRNYGGNDSPLWQRAGPGREHNFPTDPRDRIDAQPALAGRATAASREYLQIVFKILYGRSVADASAVQEANAELEQFVLRHFSPC